MLIEIIHCFSIFSKDLSSVKYVLVKQKKATMRRFRNFIIHSFIKNASLDICCPFLKRVDGVMYEVHVLNKDKIKEKRLILLQLLNILIIRKNRLNTLFKIICNHQLLKLFVSSILRIRSILAISLRA
jgi:hypothetical protein